MKGCLAGSKAENLLEQGDMVLAINKEPVTCFRDIENVCQALEKTENKDGKLSMTIFRQVKIVCNWIPLPVISRCFLFWLGEGLEECCV